MLENKIESHWNETIRGFLFRPDTDGPGRILQRYLSNGIYRLEDYYKNKDCRATVLIDTDIDQDIVIDRPVLLRFTENFNNTLYIKSERVFVDSDLCSIKKVVIMTDSDSYCDTCEVLTKIAIADCTIDHLVIRNANNLMLIDTTVNNLQYENVTNFMRLAS